MAEERRSRGFTVVELAAALGGGGTTCTFTLSRRAPLPFTVRQRTAAMHLQE